MKKINVNVEQMQYYLSKGIILHPTSYKKFLCELKRLQNSEKISMIPITIFHHFHSKLNIAS